MSQLSALAANQRRARRLPYSIITVPRPGWMFHNARLRSTVLNLSMTSFSTSAAGTPGTAVGGALVSVGKITCVGTSTVGVAPQAAIMTATTISDPTITRLFLSDIVTSSFG